jgi:hydroxyacylglutathione hydrolase
MLVTAFPAAVLGTNCYVVSRGPGEECVVIDPGIGTEDRLGHVLRSQGLRPAAILLTHGHIDHVYGTAAVCDVHAVTVHIHRDDRYRLVDPLAGLDTSLRAMLSTSSGAVGAWHEPEDVVELDAGDRLEVAGMVFGVVHAPGHTEGSVLFTVDDVPDGVDATSTVFSGDVLFAGSVGRTDLPGGDDSAMTRTLRQKILSLPETVLVLPGHGPATTMGEQIRVNPYLVHVAG